jgi:hypothetical protein
MLLHFDNASPHTARLTIEYMHQNRLCRIIQLPFSPHLAPSNFCLFGKMKPTLMGAIFDDENQLCQVVMTVLDEISREQLERVCKEWLAGLDA